MRQRVAALSALFALVVLPAASGAAQHSHASMLHVSVKPRAGSPRTHFAISFLAAQTTGRIGPAHRVYRVTAGDAGGAGCQSSAVAVAPPSRAGTTVRVRLVPTRAGGWCAGTFRGQVWDEITEPCPVGKACPAILPLPRMVGKFTFRVTRG